MDEYGDHGGDDALTRIEVHIGVLQVTNDEMEPPMMAIAMDNGPRC